MRADELQAGGLGESGAAGSDPTLGTNAAAVCGYSGYSDGQPTRFFTAESGNFEEATTATGTKVMRQQVTKRPIEWEHNAEPYTFTGDNRWPN